MRRSLVPRKYRERLARLEAQLDRIEGRLEVLGASAEGTLAAQRELHSRLEHELRPLLLSLVRDDPGNRRRLFELRAEPAYELAYTDPAPLVTIAIPTVVDRSELLLRRSLPSALAQSHTNLEVVIVGDAIGPAAAERLLAALDRLGEERVRFADLTQRFVHPDPEQQHLTGSTNARNEAYRLARGRWIAELDDDDALRPHAVEKLLELARGAHLEVAYGLKERREVGGGRSSLGAFPPAPLYSDWRERGLRFQPWEGAAACRCDRPRGAQVLRARARRRRGPRPRGLLPPRADGARRRSLRDAPRDRLRLLPVAALAGGRGRGGGLK